jgi:hypothetical protein
LHDDPNIDAAALRIVAGSASIVIAAIIGPIDAARRQNGVVDPSNMQPARFGRPVLLKLA